MKPITNRVLSSYLSPESNNTLHALTAAPELLIRKIVNFSPIRKISIWAQNWTLLIKTSPEACSIFKTEPQKHKNQNGMQNDATRLTSKNELFNCSSFGNFEIIVGSIKTSPRVVSDSNFESWLSLHAKRDKLLLTI